MASLKGSLRPKLRGQKAIPHSGGDLGAVIQQTLRLWHKHHLSYDQTKYVVESVRRRLELDPSHSRKRTVSRLDQSEVERLVQTTYRNHSKYGLMIKTLFQTGARVGEFVHIGVEDLLLDGDLPQIHIAHAKGGADRYVPVLPALAQSCVPIFKDVKEDFCSRATAIRAIRDVLYSRSSPDAPAPQASRNGSFHTFCGIQ